jgi:hypothetical protein
MTSTEEIVGQIVLASVVAIAAGLMLDRLRSYMGSTRHFRRETHAHSQGPRMGRKEKTPSPSDLPPAA